MGVRTGFVAGGKGAGRIVALACVGALLAGCGVFSPPHVQRGILVSQDQLNELIPGTTTRKDVESLIGSPSAHATFDDNTWIYISEVTHTRIGQLPGVARQDVTVLTFDDGGVLRAVKRLGSDDAKPVEMVSRATPSPGSETSFLQMLLGNVGRFGPAGVTPSSSGASGNTLP